MDACGAPVRGVVPSAVELREQLAAQGVHTLIVQFTDLHGIAKGKLVPLPHLDRVLADGAGFSGPSISGTGLDRMGARSEYHAVGDASTVQALPWLPGHARIVGDGRVDGAPFDACPRQVLKRALARLAERDWSLAIGIEPEFFLLKRDPAGRLVPADDDDRLDKPSYDLKSLPRQAGLLHELHASLAACGFDVLQIDHEDAHGQYELNFAHADALLSADRLMLFKQAAHAIAERHGCLFSMMPKPFADQPGSGMHLHVSLWHTPAGAHAGAAANLFVAAAGDAALPPLARHFIGGVLQHACALAALAAPTVNSYKRLVVGKSLSGTSWAPATVAYGPNNRTALIRTLPDRFEWRLPDAAANPYLATAALVAAGLDGIDRELDPGAPTTIDLFELSPLELRARGLAPLPQSLGEAVDALERDEVLANALGATLHGEFVRLKRAEWADYAHHVSDWERERYATLF
jgi:glutamine synthetase